MCHLVNYIINNKEKKKDICLGLHAQKKWNR